LESDLFIEQKGIRSLVDKDARVGYKSKTQSFYGYKAELCQTTDGKIITSIIVEPGNYVDGCRFKDHIETTEQSGLKSSFFLYQVKDISTTICFITIYSGHGLHTGKSQRLQNR
jgi:hypothetical protein